MTTSTDPDRFLKTHRFNTAAGLILTALGIAIIAASATSAQPPSRVSVVFGQIGSAVLAAGLIELVLFTGIQQLKLFLTARWRALFKDIEASQADVKEILKETDELLQEQRETNERLHWKRVETELQFIRNDLEVIHRIVDPQYGDLMRRLEEQETRETK
jgi:hypothetical protein